jgi:hypothetical protein
LLWEASLAEKSGEKRMMREPNAILTPLLVSLVSVLLGSGWVAVDAQASLSIGSAVWKASRSQLDVKGIADPKQQVTVSDASTSASLGTANSNNKGAWKLRARKLPFAPCSIRADSNGQSAEIAVTGAPASCTGGPGPGPGPGTKPDVSINSTSHNCGAADGSGQVTCPGAAVAQQPVVGGSKGYQVLVANDLGMHCGDLDTRALSILPPFNVLHAQVIRKGSPPRLQTGSQVDVYYSAASSASDPALGKSNSAGFDLAGGVYKTNFWATVDLGAYDPFYPPAVNLPALMSPDLGLPVPDPAVLTVASAAQQTMPGAAGPFAANDPQKFARFDQNLQFFVANFPQFGYWANGVNWFAADGIPLTAFDDFGRVNAYPLTRVQAVKKRGNPSAFADQLASTDTVTPISGEADCKSCHADPQDGGNGAALPDSTVTASQDPQAGKVPPAVSVEWATDINILRLHDQKSATTLYTAVSAADPTPQKPVVCQTCHYTPALDLLQVGPQDTVNGLQQSNHRSMSRVIHAFHAQVSSVLATSLPAPNAPERSQMSKDADCQGLTNAQCVLQKTCYQCHPGKNTKCLRGAMASAGIVCQDCHGSLAQVGNDFSLGFPTPDFSRRVPWATEPGCQSCPGATPTPAPSSSSASVSPKTRAGTTKACSTAG